MCKINENDASPQIIVAAFDREWASRIQQIRKSVFSLEQNIDPSLDLDGQDPGAVHVLAKMNGQFVGTGRMLGDGHIGRLAVLKPARGKGIGKELVKQLLDVAGAQGMGRVFLGAQEQAVGFYEKLGFLRYGLPYEEAGIRHMHMERMIQSSL